MTNNQVGHENCSKPQPDKETVSCLLRTASPTLAPSSRATTGHLTLRKKKIFFPSPPYFLSRLRKMSRLLTLPTPFRDEAIASRTLVTNSLGKVLSESEALFT